MINEIIKVNSKYRERVNSFINEKKLFIKPNFPPIYVKDITNWNTDEKLSRTEEVYLESLLIVKDIIKYKLSNEKDYSEIARKIIEKWWDENQENVHTWKEHAVAERILNIIYFQENSSIKLKTKKYNLILETHLEYLYSSNNYKKNNHGLMMDRSLLIGSYYNGNHSYRERAIDRFYIFIYRDFSTNGIHLENSPEYHSLALKIVQEFQLVFKKMSLKIDIDVKNIINKARVYLPKLSRPDSTLPLLGDSGYKKILNKKLYGHIVDHTSGVFLYQDIEYKNWLLVTNGYQRLTHKHKDDMSIQFSRNYLNVLVDSGKYSYDKDSEIRKYLLSDKAHSKPFILERRPKFDVKENLWTNIILDDIELYHIEMTHHQKDDFQILRNVILHKATSTLFVIDRFSSKEHLTYISNYVLNPEINIELNNNQLDLIGEDITFNSPSRIKLRSKENDKLNWFSSHFNQFEHTNRVFISSSGHFSEQVVMIGDKNIKKDVYIDRNNVKVLVNNKEYNIGISKIERWKV